MTLLEAALGKPYTVTHIDTDDEELIDFLFTLGCYEGQSVVVVSHISRGYVVAIRDGRYNIDANLAQAICIAEN
ncbi:FeoA family protein [Bengtsoniella intestinalis]|uniref:FeoA family protein n=1 Tax=Bengtsoniella intestinalis TaxID=3073143 RepID=UPI00391F28C0